MAACSCEWKESLIGPSGTSRLLGMPAESLSPLGDLSLSGSFLAYALQLASQRISEDFRGFQRISEVDHQTLPCRMHLQLSCLLCGRLRFSPEVSGFSPSLGMRCANGCAERRRHLPTDYVGVCSFFPPVFQRPSSIVLLGHLQTGSSLSRLPLVDFLAHPSL